MTKIGSESYWQFVKLFLKHRTVVLWALIYEICFLFCYGFGDTPGEAQRIILAMSSEITQGQERWLGGRTAATHAEAWCFESGIPYGLPSQPEMI